MRRDFPGRSACLRSFLTQDEMVMNGRLVRRTWAVLLLAGFALLLLSPSRLEAQTAASGAITGKVTDKAGHPLENVSVTATNRGTGDAREEIGRAHV